MTSLLKKNLHPPGRIFFGKIWVCPHAAFLLPIGEPSEALAERFNSFFTLNVNIMEIIGRLTADAQVSEIKDGRKVVNFNVAVNDYYRTKAGEARRVTEFFRCAYWISPKVAVLLTKGTLVSLYGRAGVDAYMGKNGEPKASLRFHTSQIKIFTTGQKQEANGFRSKPNEQENAQEDDLPF